MGVIDLEGVVAGPTGKQAAVRFLVDSGAIYTLLPQEVWQAIELTKRPAVFPLADGTTLERRISECHLTLPQREGHTPAILGEAGVQAVLGVVPLEIFGLVVTRELQPMHMLLV